MTRIFGVLALAGCPAGDPPAGRTCDDLLAGDLPSCDVADACRGEDTGDRVDCAERIGWSRSCDPDWRGADGGTSQVGLLYAGGLPDVPYSRAATFTFTDAASFDAWVAEGWGDDRPSLPDVDFAEQIVVVVQRQQNSTCGMSLARHGVWSSESEVYPTEVYVEIEDSSGSCSMVCDMTMRLGVIYAVDRARGWPETCATVVNRCE
jgi:hypothetical protein